MMNYVWTMMIAFSFICAIFNGNMQLLSDSIVTGGQNAITLCIKLLGMMCLWGGIMKIADKSGLTSAISKFLNPVFSHLFTNVEKNSPTSKAISMNVTANLLGLGNAATPLGLEAMKRMQEENSNPLVATNDMIVFVVMNSAAMRIIPTTVATLRTQYGSSNPMEIIPATWISTFLSLSVGIISAKLLSKIKIKSTISKSDFLPFKKRRKT